MKLLAFALHERVVEGVLEQRVLEEVRAVRRPTFLEENLGPNKFVQLRAQRGFAQVGYRRQQFVAELAAERGGQLGDLLLALHAVEARVHQVLQRGRDLVGGQDRGGVLLACLSRRGGLLHHLRELFDEQRHAARAIVDLLDERVRERALRFLADQVRGLATREAIERQARLMGDGRPRRFEFRAKRQHGQDAVVQSLLDELRQEFERRSVDPVQILDDEQNWLSLSPSVQPVEQHAKRFFPLPNRRERKLREPLGRRQRQQRGPERHGFGPGQLIVLQMIEQAVEAILGRFVAVEVERTLERINRRVKSRVVKMGRAAPLDHRVVGRGVATLAANVTFERVDEARFSQARLADDEHNLPHSLLSLFPAILEQMHLVIAAREG